MNNTDRQYMEKFLTVLQASDPDAKNVLMQAIDTLYNCLEAGTNADDERPDNVVCFKDVVG